VRDHEQYDLFRGGIDAFTATKPTVVAHVQAMCRSFSELTKVYSHEELNQGLWAVFGAGISCERYLFDPTVDLGLRIGCIESMFIPFKDVVAHSLIDKRNSFYWMWWDIILHTFWHIYYGTDDNYQKLSADGRQMFDAMYQTLLNILALDHPDLDAHRDELADEDLRWIEAFRDGTNP
jgi:hypothetical protein